MERRDITVHLKYSAAVVQRDSGTTHPSHSIHRIDMQRFIDISSLDGSPHTGRNPVLSKSATDGCIELFWSISSDLLCLGVCVCVHVRARACVFVCIDDV